MAGGTITPVEIIPANNRKFIFFTGTTDASKKLDFSAYPNIYLVQAWDATTGGPGGTAEAVVTVTNGGDVTFTNAANAIVGWAIVQD